MFTKVCKQCGLPYVCEKRQGRQFCVSCNKAKKAVRNAKLNGRRSEYLAKWRCQNRDRIRGYERSRNVLLNKHRVRAQAAELTPGERRVIAKFYQHVTSAKTIRCYLCGKPVPKSERQVDHVVPLARGGKHRLANLKCACAGCNNRKKDKMPEELSLLTFQGNPHV